MYRIVSKDMLTPTICRMKVEAPRLASAALPGQFLIIRADEQGERVPLTISDFDKEAGTVTIVTQKIGASTTEICTYEEGDTFADVVGPLGVPSFFPDEDTMMNFLGIDAKDCKQYMVAICAEGMRSDEVWLIQAKNASSLEKLKKLAETRIEAKKDETVSYAPDQYVVVEKAAVLTKGNYLALLISPDVDALKAGFEAAFQ